MQLGSQQDLKLRDIQGGFAFEFQKKTLYSRALANYLSKSVPFHIHFIFSYYISVYCYCTIKSHRSRLHAWTFIVNICLFDKAWGKSSFLLDVPLLMLPYITHILDQQLLRLSHTRQTMSNVPPLSSKRSKKPSLWGFALLHFRPESEHSRELRWLDLLDTKGPT